MDISKLKLKVKEITPEILVIAGVVGLVGAGVIACRQTLKLKDVKNRHKDEKEDLNEIKEELDASENGEITLLKVEEPEVSDSHDENIRDVINEEILYSMKDYNKELTIYYRNLALDYIKLYGPSITLGILSIVGILSGFNIIKKRGLAAMAAYKVLESTFTTYREKVKDKMGEKKEKELYSETRREVSGVKVIEQETEDGKKEKTLEVDRELLKQYGYLRLFDETNWHWQRDNMINMEFLRTKEQEWNNKLRERGHVFLNEVLESLGFDHTSKGALVGWVYEGDGDGFIDFGLLNLDSEPVRNFLRGAEYSVLLEFNVDGPIWDKI